MKPSGFAREGFKFNDKEGDSDKWARTILSWLRQVGWVKKSKSVALQGQNLACYEICDVADRVLRTTAKSSIKYIPEEMLCSVKHPFCAYVQRRRYLELKALNQGKTIRMTDLIALLLKEGVDITEETLKFDIINFKNIGLRVERELELVRLLDKVELDGNTKRAKEATPVEEGIEEEIKHYVTMYEDTIPAKLINNLLLNAYSEIGSPTLFEGAVCNFFSFMGFESQLLGQGRGRVADVIAKYRSPRPVESYAIIVDAKAYSVYDFPAADVRKMKEYINKHTPQLMEEHISKFAYAFISFDFSSSCGDKLNEIADDTSVAGVAIDIPTLLAYGSRIIKSELKLQELYPLLCTNQRLRS